MTSGRPTRNFRTAASDLDRGCSLTSTASVPSPVVRMCERSVAPASAGTNIPTVTVFNCLSLPFLLLPLFQQPATYALTESGPQKVRRLHQEADWGRTGAR